MQIIQTNLSGIIEKAQSDCGRVQFSPIGNDRIIINGRDAWRGGYENGGRVEADLWAIACDLMQDVTERNTGILDNARRDADRRAADRDEAIAGSLKGTRGTYADPNTF